MTYTVTSDETSDTPVYSDAGLQDLEFIALSKRGLSLETCRKFGYGVDGDGNQRATYHDRAGAPVAQKVRTADKRFWVDGAADSMTLFGQQLWKPGRALIVTEGELDALSVYQAFAKPWPVVSVPQGAQSAARFFRQELEWLEGFDRVVLMFDMDEPGQAAARECAQILSPGKACVAKLPLKDASDMLQARKAGELVKAFWEAPVWAPEDLVSGDDLWDSALNYTEPPSLPYPYPGLQALTRGLRLGELATIMAGTGVGKSTLMRELATHWALGGHKIGYIAVEETKTRAAVGFLSVAMSRPLHMEAPDAETRAAMQEAAARLAPNVVAYNGKGVITVDALLAKVRYLARGAGCKVIFVDHLSKIVTATGGDDERRMIDAAMDALSQVCVETGAAVVLVCHVNSGDKGTTHEEGARVKMSHARGSRAIGQYTFDMFALERNQQSDDATVATLRVLKCRHTGRTGVAGHLEYHRDTGRLLECSAPDSNEDF